MKTVLKNTLEIIFDSLCSDELHLYCTNARPVDAALTVTKSAFGNWDRKSATKSLGFDMA